MSYADEQFVLLCNDIIENGTTTENQRVRPHWEDGSSAYTIKKFGHVVTYDLRKEFPALTLRKTAIKSAMDEILWIYQKKSNNINDLNSHIWDAWADHSGSIGKAYGYQVGHRHLYRNKREVSPEEVLSNPDKYSPHIVKQVEEEYSFVNNASKLGLPKRELIIQIGTTMDQMDAVLYDLKHTPFSRRIMISLWDVEDLDDMRLQPCCWSINFNVTDDGYDKLVLNMVLNQRSSDTLTANNWNAVQYALLLMMVAQVSNMIPGKLMHVITDAHIYDRHIPIVKELITKPQYPAPKVTLNPDITDFYNFTTGDITIENYVTSEFNHKIPVAI